MIFFNFISFRILLGWNALKSVHIYTGFGSRFLRKEPYLAGALEFHLVWGGGKSYPLSKPKAASWVHNGSSYLRLGPSSSHYNQNYSYNKLHLVKIE